MAPLPAVQQIESNFYRVGKETFSLRIKVRFWGRGEEGREGKRGVCEDSFTRPEFL